VDAAEAVRHALGGVVEELATNLILLDAGVHAARKEQDTSGTEYQSIGSGVEDCIDMGVEVYADKGSLREQHLEPSDLAEGVKVVNSHEIAGLIKEAWTSMIF
jgi:predicted peroxiredoxin